MNDRKRRIKDAILKGLTYLSSSISALILAAIMVFVIARGLPGFDPRMMTSDYYETSYFVKAEAAEDLFELRDGNGVYYSLSYGIGLKDSKDFEGNHSVAVAYVAPNSPLKGATPLSGDSPLSLKVDQIIKRIVASADEATLILTPRLGAEGIARGLDQASSISECYFASMGGGIRGSLLTTVLLIAVTLLISMPLGIVAAIYLSIYAKKNKLTSLMRHLIDMISGVPSLIFGLLGMLVFIPFVSKIGPASGGSILSGALTLSVMLLPTIIKTTEESINNIPKGYRHSSLALGASESETVFKVILPNALPGITNAILLSVGRIIGESAALIFAIGTSIQDDVSLFRGSTSLSVHIWCLMSGENPNYRSACAISILILFAVLLLNGLTHLLYRQTNIYVVAK